MLVSMELKKKISKVIVTMTTTLSTILKTKKYSPLVLINTTSHLVIRKMIRVRKMILGRRMIRVAIIKQAEDSEEGEEDDDDYLLYIDIFVDLESYNDLKNY